MTTTAVGAYILLLCKAWHEKPPASVPNNDSILARWARLNEAEWAICKPLVLSAFTLRKDNRWHQKRLREEYDKLQRYFQTRSNSGKKGAENRWHKPQEDNGLNGTAITNPIAKNSNSKSKSKSKTDNTPPYPPEGGLCAGLNTQESKPPEPPKPKGRPDYYTDEGQKRRAIALSILHEVNERCGKHFPDLYKAGLGVIKDRLIEGREPHEFSRIIEVKLHDPLFQQKPNLYDPRTLFAADKFDTYLNQDPDGWNSNKGKPTPKPEPVKPPIVRRTVNPDPELVAWFRRTVVDPMRDEVNEHAWKAFIEPLVPVSKNGDGLVLYADRNVRQWVEEHRLSQIAALAGCGVRIIDDEDE